MTDLGWQFPDGTCVLISKMRDFQLYPATIECYKRMYAFQKKAYYAEYRMKISSKPKLVKYWKGKKEHFENQLMVHANKLEALDEKAEELNIEISDDIKTLKQDYARFRENHKRQKTGTGDRRRDIKERFPERQGGL